MFNNKVVALAYLTAVMMLAACVSSGPTRQAESEGIATAQPTTLHQGIDMIPTNEARSGSNEFVESFAGYRQVGQSYDEAERAEFLLQLAVALTESPDGMVTIEIRPVDSFGDPLSGVKLGYDPDKNSLPDDERQETSDIQQTLSVEVRSLEDLGVWVLIAPNNWCHKNTTYEVLDIVPTYSLVCQ